MSTEWKLADRMREAFTRYIIILILISIIAPGCLAQIRNLDYIIETGFEKYNWDYEAANNLVLENRHGELTKNEVDGLKAFILNYPLPTHNYLNYYFRNRSYSYMMEWLLEKEFDIDILDKSIQFARTCIAYRNDQICEIDERFTCYAIDYSRTIAPVWPNYKKEVETHNGIDCLDPGAGSFAGVPVLTVPVRMIAEHPEIWEVEYEGKTYRTIADELIAEVLLTVDYVYNTMVGEDNLIRYTSLVNTEEWGGFVYIYNRVFPIISGTIPLLDAFEKLEIYPGKAAKIDSVNRAMVQYFIDDITLYEKNGKEVLNYPYGDYAQYKNPLHSEDFTHGSLDSRDLQYIFKSNRYGLNKRHMQAMANTIVEVTYLGNGEFTYRLDGSGGLASTSPINFDGYIWYATYREELNEIIVDHILDQNIAVNNGVYDAVSLFEILKLKEANENNGTTTGLYLPSAELTIFPNPFTTSVTVSMEHPSPGYLTLIDIQGRAIQSKEINEERSVTFSPSYHKAPVGVYILGTNGVQLKNSMIIRR